MRAETNYFYLYKGKRYYTTAIGKMKHPNTGMWIPAVFYQGMETENEGDYCREQKDFESKFILIPPHNEQ